MNLIDRDHLLKKANEELQEGLITDDDLEAVYYELSDEPTVDAVPVELIQKRIDALKEVADAEFEINGGYVGPAYALVCMLEGLLREWEERKEE